MTLFRPQTHRPLVLTRQTIPYDLRHQWSHGFWHVGVLKLNPISLKDPQDFDMILLTNQTIIHVLIWDQWILTSKRRQTKPNDSKVPTGFLQVGVKNQAI